VPASDLTTEAHFEGSLRAPFRTRQQGTDEIVSLERRFSRCTALGPPSARACNVYAGEEHSRGVCLLLLVIRSGGGSAVVGSGG